MTATLAQSLSTPIKNPLNCGIYAITHLASGKRYVGSSKMVDKRLLAHKALLRKNSHDNDRLQHAWNKYGESEFDFSKILICTLEDRIFYEQSIMDKYQSTDRNFGFNLSLKASHPEHCKDTREKMRLAKLGKPSPLKGILRSEEIKIKMRDGRRLAYLEGRIGGHHKPHSEESKEKMRLSHIGQIAWNKGKKMSDESRKKMSEKRISNFSNPEFLSKWNAKKLPYCRKGHFLGDDNLILISRKNCKERACRACARMRNKKYRLSKRFGL